MTQRINGNRNLETIVAQLAADGFPSDIKTARKVQLASMRGLLYWTKRFLTTQDESRLDLRPRATSSRRHRRLTRKGHV